MTSDAPEVVRSKTDEIEILFRGARRFLIRRIDSHHCWYLYTAHHGNVGDILEVSADVVPLIRCATCLLGFLPGAVEDQIEALFAMFPKYEGDQVEVFIDLLEAEGKYRCAARIPGGVETGYATGIGDIAKAKEVMRKWCDLHGYEVGILRVRRDLHRARMVREDSLPIEPW